MTRLLPLQLNIADVVKHKVVLDKVAEKRNGNFKTKMQKICGSDVDSRSGTERLLNRANPKQAREERKQLTCTERGCLERRVEEINTPDVDSHKVSNGKCVWQGTVFFFFFL